jgi:hypothetical protein
MSIDTSSRSPGAPTGKASAVAAGDQDSTRTKTEDWWRKRNPASALKTSASDRDQSQERAVDLVDEAKETARATGIALASQASELAGNIGGELTETAEEQKSRGADAMRGFAKAVHGAANELDSQSPAMARHIRSAAESVEGLSDTIRSRSVSDLIATASDTARTRPAAFFIGAVAAGFALSRFFKSTSRPSGERPDLASVSNPSVETITEHGLTAEAALAVVEDAGERVSAALRPGVRRQPSGDAL